VSAATPGPFDPNKVYIVAPDAGNTAPEYDVRVSRLLEVAEIHAVYAYGERST